MWHKFHDVLMGTVQNLEDYSLFLTHFSFLMVGDSAIISKLNFSIIPLPLQLICFALNLLSWLKFPCLSDAFK